MPHYIAPLQLRARRLQQMKNAKSRRQQGHGEYREIGGAGNEREFFDCKLEMALASKTRPRIDKHCVYTLLNCITTHNVQCILLLKYAVKGILFAHQAYMCLHVLLDDRYV